MVRELLELASDADHIFWPYGRSHPSCSHVSSTPSCFYSLCSFLPIVLNFERTSIPQAWVLGMLWVLDMDQDLGGLHGVRWAQVSWSGQFRGEFYFEQ